MTTWFTRTAYNILLVLLVPVLFFYSHWRSLRQTRRPDNWRQRFAMIEPTPGGRVIWLHAASVGEVQAAIPLVRAMRSAYLDCQFVLTAFTSAGVDRLRAEFQDRVRVTRLPYDLEFVLVRFLNRIRPSCCIVVETEIWPNLFRLLKVRNVPLLYVSARMSGASVEKYRKLGEFLREAMQHVSWVTAQSETDAARFTKLGVPENRIEVTGNLKFDIEIAASSVERGRALRSEWLTGRRVFLAASTRIGEDELLLDAFMEMRAQVPDLALVIVPRHPERATSIEQLADSRDFSVGLFSRGDKTPRDILLVDTIGDLVDFYSAADLVFVGGSLVPVGGHNLVEPAALGLPILTGRYHFNAPVIADELRRHDGLVMVNSGSELVRETVRLFGDNEERTRLGEAACAVVDNNRGALQASLQRIEQFLPR